MAVAKNAELFVRSVATFLLQMRGGRAELFPRRRVTYMPFLRPKMPFFRPKNNIKLYYAKVS